VFVAEVTWFGFGGDYMGLVDRGYSGVICRGYRGVVGRG
jgi:hypothetical protein